MPNLMPHSVAILKDTNSRRLNKNTKSKYFALAGAMLGSIVMFSGCATKPVYQNTQGSSVQINNNGVPNYYKVQSGDTVSKIARRYGLNYRQVGALNQLDSRYTIYKGQWLKLWDSRASAPTQVGSTRTINRVPNNPYNTNRPTTSAPPVNTPTNYNLAQGYNYPTRNSVIKNFDANKGVDSMWFSGRLGDPVLASKGGEVLYSGKDLTEYGNLVMIRHDEEYITVYAHNNQLLVKEGDRVTAGQKIATMGNTGQIDQVTLQFQVRKDGVPVDPRTVLGR